MIEVILNHKDIIIVRLLPNPGFEELRTLFQNCLPHQEQFFLKPSDCPSEILTLELIQEKIEQFKLKILPSLGISFAPDIFVVNNAKQNHQLIVFVGGIVIYRDQIASVCKSLEQYIRKETTVQTESVTYQCKNKLKEAYGIDTLLSTIKANTKGVIKRYSVKEDNVVKVEYAKLKRP